VILMAVGDVMLGRTIGELIETHGPAAPFLYTTDTLRSADITVGNLECPISTRGTAADKAYAFRAPLAAAESLATAGFDLVNLANNHILDYGPLALADTLEILASQDVQAVGAGMDTLEAHAPVIVEINGLRVAFLGYMDVPPSTYDFRSWEAGPNQPGVAWAHEERVQQGVTAAKAKADIVIVLVHNGYEFMQQITSQQQKIAHLAIDSGASLVIGSHPHVLQRVERYKGGLIAYSMGNFVFDNFLFPPNYSAILVAELSPQGVDDYELIDVIVQLNGIPKISPYSLED
jgi:poly-gamma-glutamate capsule biosynthesis protein CapA/YwtB (metallophosphatase superfamily)